jgi:hypothetical protein
MDFPQFRPNGATQLPPRADQAKLTKPRSPSQNHMAKITAKIT